jgi:prepilin-type N-terminal cleavage/methylation domain-containing protein
MFFLRRKSQGFTLIEVMIALAVLAAGLLALATMQIVSIRSNAFSSEMTSASMVALRELEELRNMDYDAVTASGPTTLPVDATTKGIEYEVQTQVFPDNPATDMKTVKLIVRWLGAPAATGQSTVQFSTTFTTVITR